MSPEDSEASEDAETETGSDAETETGNDAETETGSDAETEGSTESDSAADNSSAESDRTEEDRVENNSDGNSGTEYDSTTPSDIAMPYGAGAAFLSGAIGDESEDDSADNGGNGSADNKGGTINNSSDDTADNKDNDRDDTADNKNNGSNNMTDNKDNNSNNTTDNKDNNSNNTTDNKDNNTNDEDDDKDNSSDGTDSGKDSDKDNSSDATPDRDRRPAARAAATVKLTSNLSGNAGCTPNRAQDRAVVAVEPSGGYTVEYVTVDGTRVAPDSGNSYSFPVEGGETYEVYVHFRKVTTRSGTVENAKSEIEYAIREAQDAANRIRDGIEANDEIDISELQKMLSATTTVMENTEILADIYGEQVAEALRAVNRDLGSTSDHLKSALDSVKAATRHTRDIVDYVNAQPDIRFAKLGAEYDYNRTNLHNQLQGISDSLKILSDNASNYSDVVNADLKAVNDQINVIFNLLADRLSDVKKLGLEEFYEDVSDEDIDSITTGRTESCSNRGIVKGDINVGGIAGSMSIDDEDPEDSAAGAVEYELGRRFITKCLVTGSVNDGYVTAKKNGAGGICGYMNHGIIVDSESYGSVESTEGDYVGGICGESLTIIKRCYALCSVTGNKNVGGIAGFADTLKNCYSMAEIQAENGRAGAIAGQVSGYDIADAGAEDGSGENAAKVVGNYYVGENVHGINNISYVGVAEPIAYEELLAVEQLPAQFEHLKVIYRIDDTYLGSEEVAYGAKLDRLNYPQIPAKEGCYGVWPDVSDRKMGGIFVVEGEYKDNVTVVQSGGAPEAADEGQWNRAYALIEDIFTEDTVLNAGVVDMDPPGEAAGKQHIVYEVTLENSGIKETDTFALRILNPYEDAVVYGYADGTWTALESKNRGQYLQVVMTGTHAYFCVAEHTSDRMVVIICATAAAAVLIVLTAVVKKTGARRKQKKPDKKRDQERDHERDQEEG